MTKNDLTSLLGGKPRVLSSVTTVWEGNNGYTRPMSPLELQLYSVLRSLTND